MAAQSEAHAPWPTFNFPRHSENLPVLELGGYPPSLLANRTLLLPEEHYLNGAQMRVLEDLHFQIKEWDSNTTIFSNPDTVRAWLRVAYSCFDILFFNGNIRRHTHILLPTDPGRPNILSGSYQNKTITVWLVSPGHRALRSITALMCTLLHEMVHAYLGLFSCARECCEACRATLLGPGGHGIGFHTIFVFSMQRLIYWIPELRTHWRASYEHYAAILATGLQIPEHRSSIGQVERTGFRLELLDDNGRRVGLLGARIGTSKDWQRRQRMRMWDGIWQAFINAPLERKVRVVVRAYPHIRGKVSEQQIIDLWDTIKLLKDRVHVWTDS